MLILNKRLLATRKGIANNQMRIERLQAKIPLITKKYDSDLVRLRQLLSTTESIN